MGHALHSRKQKAAHPPFHLGQKGKRHPSADAVVRHHEVNDAIGRDVVDEAVLPHVCSGQLPVSLYLCILIRMWRNRYSVYLSFRALVVPNGDEPAREK